MKKTVGSRRYAEKEVDVILGKSADLLYATKSCLHGQNSRMPTNSSPWQRARNSNSRLPCLQIDKAHFSLSRSSHMCTRLLESGLTTDDLAKTRNLPTGGRSPAAKLGQQGSLSDADLLLEMICARIPHSRNFHRFDANVGISSSMISLAALSHFSIQRRLSVQGVPPLLPMRQLLRLQSST